MMSVNNLQSLMLAAMSSEWDKQVGTPTYDFTRAFAEGLGNVEVQLENLFNNLNVDVMQPPLLDDYIFQRKGLTRKQGTRAQATLTAQVVAGRYASIKEGASFQTTDGVVFLAKSSKKVSNGGTFEVESASTGLYNVDANTITVITSSINNLTGITNASAATGGSAFETNDELRARYYDAIYDASNGANVGAYETWAKSINGVFEARCLPATATNSCTLQIVMKDNSGHATPANANLISNVKSIIDPGNGDGSGLAPLGANCVVAAPTTQTVTVVCTYDGSATLESATVEKVIADYFDSIAIKTTKVYYSKLMKAVMQTPGVDWCTITLNGSAADVEITGNKLAVPTISVTPANS